MVVALEELREAWEAHRECMMLSPNVMDEDPELQRILAQVTMRSQYTIAIPRLLDYERAYGRFRTFKPILTPSNVDEVQKTRGASG